MLLALEQHLGGEENSLDRVHWLYTTMTKQAKPSDAEACMENVYHIAGSVRDTTHLRVLMCISHVPRCDKSTARHIPGTAK